MRKKNKRSKDLGALLDGCSWDDIGNFLQTCIKNSLLQTKSIEIWVNSHTVTHYMHVHVSILDHIQHLNFDLSGSLKVKCDSVTGLPVYGFLLMFNSTCRVGHHSSDAPTILLSGVSGILSHAIRLISLFVDWCEYSQLLSSAFSIGFSLLCYMVVVIGAANGNSCRGLRKISKFSLSPSNCRMRLFGSLPHFRHGFSQHDILGQGAFIVRQGHPPNCFSGGGGQARLPSGHVCPVSSGNPSCGIT